MCHSLTIAEARRIVSDSAAIAWSSPQLRKLAWATLKTARGQTCVQHRMLRAGADRNPNFPGDAA